MTASPLAAFLAGHAAAPAAEADFSLEHRHAEGGPWTPFRWAGERAPLDDEMRAPAFALGYGDLVRLRRYAAPSGFRWTLDTWVQARRGTELVEPGLRNQLVPDDDWATLWEEGRLSAYDLLTYCDPVDAPRLVRMACAAARAAAEGKAVRERPSGNLRPANKAVAAALAWAAEARGAEGPRLLAASRRAAERAWRAGEESGEPRGPFRYACEAAAWAAQRGIEEAPESFEGRRAIRRAAVTACWAAATALAEGGQFASPAAYNDAQRAVGDLIRAELPLSVLLLAWAGDDTFGL